MKGSYYNSTFLIIIVTKGEKKALYIVECPDDWKGTKLMTYSQIKHWEQTGKVNEWKAYTESRAKSCLRQKKITQFV